MSSRTVKHQQAYNQGAHYFGGGRRQIEIEKVDSDYNFNCSISIRIDRRDSERIRPTLL